MFASTTAQQSQFESLLYLHQLCSDHKGGESLDTQLVADDEVGEDKVVSNTREDIIRKHLII